MRRPRSGVGAELVPLVLILACLAGSLAMIVAVHRRAIPRRRPPEAASVAVALPPTPPASRLAPPPAVAAVEPEPEPEPPAPPPPEDPTPKALARLTAAEAEQLLEASRADRKATVLEEARKAAVAESGRWRRRESLVNSQLSTLEAKARKAEAEADELAAERDALLRERDARKAAVAQVKARPGQAILPHKGPNGTWRRPIVVECTNGMAILQPRGIGFGLLELASGFGPSSNPFVATIAREAIRIRREESPDGAPVVPYIFFLVRPDGVRPYYEARGRLEPLGITFGYELADQDWQVDFPDLDDVKSWDGSAPSPPPGTDPLALAPPRLPGSSPAEDEHLPAWGPARRGGLARRDDGQSDADFTWPGRKAIALAGGGGSPIPGQPPGSGTGPEGPEPGGRSAGGPGRDPLEGIPGLSPTSANPLVGQDSPGMPALPVDRLPEGGGNSDDPGKMPSRAGRGLLANPGPAAGQRAGAAPNPRTTSVTGDGTGLASDSQLPGTGGTLPPGAFGSLPPGAGPISGPSGDLAPAKPAGSNPGGPRPAPASSTAGGPEVRPTPGSGRGDGEPGPEFVWPAKPRAGARGPRGESSSIPLPQGPGDPDGGPPVPHRGPFTRPLAMGVTMPTDPPDPTSPGARGSASPGSSTSSDGSGNRGSGGGPPSRKMIGQAGASGGQPSSGQPPQSPSGIGIGTGSAPPGLPPSGSPSMGSPPSGTPPTGSAPKVPTLPDLGTGQIIDRRFEVVVVCGPRGVIVQPGGYRVTTNALKDRDGLLRNQMVALVKARRAADPKVILEPKVRFLVQPGGDKTYWAARSQVLLSGLDWPSTTQVADPDPLAILPSEGW